MDVVPCIVLNGLSDAQRRALVLADNKLALNAGWDDELLSSELFDLDVLGYDLTLTGFNPDEINALFADPTEGLTDPDDVPSLPKDPVTVLGDIWLLGDHKIICGSSTDAHTVEALLGSVKPHLMVTDPPYGVEYDANRRNEAARKSGRPLGDRAIGKVLNDANDDWRDAWALFPGEVAYVWHAGTHASNVFDSLVASTFEIRAQIIWAKQQFTIGRGPYHFQHEPCWYAVRKGGTGHSNSDRKQTTLWQIDKPQKSETGHSTQKPVECMKRPIENNSKIGDAVYEPFSGSGTTIIAGEMTSRPVYAIELNPAYVDIAATRWQDFTGKKALLFGTDKTFGEMAAQRGTTLASKVA